MKPVGEVFKLRATYAEIREELTPHFSDVVRNWMGEPIPTRFRDPEYVYSSTYFTDPLKNFIKGIAEALTIPQPSGGPLEKSFGFGKTHAMILLWHLFNSDLAQRHPNLKELGITDNLVRSTLVLGLDFREKKPLSEVIRELEIYSDPTHPASRFKDPRLLEAISSTLSKYDLETEPMSHEVANLISDIMVRYRELGGEPRLLFLIDELGFGLSLKLRTYCEEFKEGRAGAEELYAEIVRFLDFLSHLYSKLEDKNVPSLIIWAITDQDKKDVESLRDRYFEDEFLRHRIDAILKQLDVLADRYKRGTGGISVAAFSYSAKHAIEIARFRVLKSVEGADTHAIASEFLKGLEALADQINIGEEFEAQKSTLETYYPFSPSLISLMNKLMKAEDVPGTEFVRTVIGTVARAAEKALTKDPTGCFTIGIKHLELHEAALVELLKELSETWIGFLTDIEQAIERASEEIKDIVSHISKSIAAKGITAIFPALLETRDKSVIARYGVNLQELQLDILASYQTPKALEMIDRMMDALNYLRAESGRVDEREVDSTKYYLPTIVKTPLAKLASFIVDERNKVKDLSQAPIYIGQSVIPSLFKQLRISIAGYPITILMKSLNDVMDDLSSDRDINEAQRSGQLAVVIIPPWDLNLFEKLYREHISYDNLVTRIGYQLNALVKANKLQRPLHLIIMIPDVSEAKLRPLLEDELAVYQATKKFIKYLTSQERSIEETVNRIVEVMHDISKRLAATLPEYAQPNRIKRRIKELITMQISDSRTVAQRNIIALSRRLTADTVGLYEKAVYFSMDQESFDSMSMTPMHRRTMERVKELKYPEIERYAPIVNKFIEDLVRTIGFSTDASLIANRIKESYKGEFRMGVVRKSDRIDDVAENVMVGAYGIRPINRKVAYDAIKLLEGAAIDLEDKTIKISINDQQGLILFRIEAKRKEKEEVIMKPPSELPPPSIAVEVKPTIRELPLAIPIDLNVQDLTGKISELVESYKGLIDNITIQIKEVKGARISATTILRDASPEDKTSIGSLINLFKILADRYGTRLAITLKFKREMELSRLKVILGDYMPKKITTFGDWLP